MGKKRGKKEGKKKKKKIKKKIIPSLPLNLIYWKEKEKKIIKLKPPKKEEKKGEKKIP